MSIKCHNVIDVAYFISIVYFSGGMNLRCLRITGKHENGKMKQIEKMIKLIGKYLREKENFTVAVIGSRGVDPQSLVTLTLLDTLMIP